MIRVPHFNLPFQFGTQPGVVGRNVSAVEQDTIEDVVNCVEIILRYPRGFRSDVPEFGIEDVTLRQQPIPLADMYESVGRWEPRAQVLFTQNLDRLDPLIARVIANVSERTP